MSTPVALLLALDGVPDDAALVSALDRSGAPTRVVRRCLDLAELLGVAEGRAASVAVVSSTLRRLDGDAVALLAACGVRVVVLDVAARDTTGDEATAPSARFAALGAAAVVGASLDADDLIALVLRVAALPAPSSSPHALADVRGVTEPDPAVPDVTPTSVEAAAGDSGLVVAVWGPIGSPGRTTVAVGLAVEAASRSRDVLLVDADTYGASVAQVLGLLDEASGLAAACRHAAVGRLDADALDRSAREVPGVPGLRVLTGLPRPDRWAELTGASVEEVLRVARSRAGLVVVDCGFSLEQDEELMFDGLAPRRNAATLVAIEQADVVLAVGGSDPVSAARFVRASTELRESVPGAALRVVLNRTTRSSRDDVAAVLARHSGLGVDWFLPEDRAAQDAFARGLTLAEVAPRSVLRAELARIAYALVPTSSGTRSAASSSSRLPSWLGFMRKVAPRPSSMNAAATQVDRAVASE